MVFLSVLCAALLARLVIPAHSVDARTASAASPRVQREVRVAGPVRAESAPETIPFLTLDLYSRIETQPANIADRDPFAFLGSPGHRQLSIGPARTARSKAPTPPSTPFKLVGYTQATAGTLIAYIVDDHHVFALQQGEEFKRRYRVVSITPSAIAFLDELLKRTDELPFPQ